MARARTGVVRRRKHNKIRQANKGYRGARSKLTRKAREAYVRAGEHAFAGRRIRRRDMRRLWIQRVNGALTEFNLPYSQFIHQLLEKKITLNRKMLSEIAIRDPQTFEKIVAAVKPIES